MTNSIKRYILDKNVNFDVLNENLDINKLIINNKKIGINEIGIINKLTNIDEISFNFCEFNEEKISLPNTLKYLSYSFCKGDVKCNCALEKLEELEILEDTEDAVIVDIDDLLQFKNLKVLRIYNCKIKNSININKYEYLEKVYLDGSLADVEDLSDILNKNIKLSCKRNYLYD